MGELTDAITHARMGVKTLDDPKNSKEYCTVAFSSLYGSAVFRRYFEQADPFPDLEDIVSRLESLNKLNPEDAETVFLLVASLLCLALCEYYWRDLSQRKTILSKFWLYRRTYVTLVDSEERTDLLSKMSVEMLSEKTGVLFDLAMFENFFKRQSL